MDAIVRIEDATCVRHGGAVAFRRVNWEIDEGQAWAIVGPTGSGKTALTDALLGRLRVEAGTITWPLLDRLRAQGRTITWPGQVFHRVSFKEESRLFSYGRHYYQQRFNFIEPLDDLSLDAFLRSDRDVTDAAIAQVAKQFGLEELRPLSLIKLSNGQIRRARLARALLGKPECLILDEPFMGLDVQGRADLAAILGRLHEQGLRIVLVTRSDLIPNWITHVKDLTKEAPRQEQIPSAIGTPIAPRDQRPHTQIDALPIIEFRDVNVSYGDRPVVRCLSWTVRRGERWAVLGPNGSGKTTLLSLICGDHPQAYSNDIWLFGKKRGSGESIWEIKSQIGLVSPEMHLYFSEPISARQAASTGFFDGLVCRATTAEQDARVSSLFEYFGVTTLLDRNFSRLSTGEQRLVLLLRALVKQPSLLILDEPFQGMDDSLVALAQRWFLEHLSLEQTLLFVSHYEHEIPAFVDKQLSLEQGRVIELGPRTARKAV